MKTAQDLRQLLQRKWGYAYDVQLRRLRDRIYFQVMWRYLEQASFPLTEEEYLAHLQNVLLYLHEWQVVDQVWQWLEQTRERPRLGRAVSLPLSLGQRATEWLGELG
ncbi:MAG: DUF3067 family protein [Gloeomargarita sp. SKYG116]|nr:DUF3067 family protein [Gloeomargarita sp. SKYG116]MCS7225587.1 DUF3067 family protein [Gloeomargarita sp. SKYB31]MDW8401341.1 DUF3067 family protein [Gloeomargarita sp. SKYGB_i_bin116]